MFLRCFSPSQYPSPETCVRVGGTDPEAVVPDYTLLKAELNLESFFGLLMAIRWQQHTSFHGNPWENLTKTFLSDICTCLCPHSHLVNSLNHWFSFPQWTRIQWDHLLSNLENINTNINNSACCLPTLHRFTLHKLHTRNTSPLNNDSNLES